jgi:hypothetical protein
MLCDALAHSDDKSSLPLRAATPRFFLGPKPAGVPNDDDYDDGDDNDESCRGNL